MSFTKKLIAAFSFFLLFSVSVFSQDSLGAVHIWKVDSKKISEGKYELTFSGTITGNWQVYAPNQILLEEKTTVLKFADSSIVQEGDFIIEGSPKEISSVIFENTMVSVYETSVQWKAIITINGTVPAKLPGTLFYTYGKNDEYYPSTEAGFVAAMEGGAEAASIKIASIDINKPINNCGDDGTKNKSLVPIVFMGLLGGWIALLAPCVLPMIPVTVTFLPTKSTDRKKGIANAFNSKILL